MKRKWIRITAAVLVCVAAVTVAGTLGINAHVKAVGRAAMLTPEEAAALEGVDCAVVLGCLVRADGTPSDMLRDRLRRGVALYQEGATPKLLMSGDHGRVDYNEVVAMKEYATAAGVPSEDVFMDHAGFSTYETMYRAREVFGAEKVLIVTQEYHLYRALYIAKQLGLEAYGVSADYQSYYGQTKRDVREVLARVKDYFFVLFRPEPTFLGEKIPVNGNGNVTND